MPRGWGKDKIRGNYLFSNFGPKFFRCASHRNQTFVSAQLQEAGDSPPPQFFGGGESRTPSIPNSSYPVFETGACPPLPGILDKPLVVIGLTLLKGILFSHDQCFFLQVNCTPRNSEQHAMGSLLLAVSLVQSVHSLSSISPLTPTQIQPLA